LRGISLKRTLLACKIVLTVRGKRTRCMVWLRYRLRS
jgi:hypothetical protein